MRAILVAIATAAVAAATAAATEAATATTTAAATESAAATAAAAESATTTAAAATTAATFFTGPGFVDGQGATAVLLAVEGRDSRLGFGVAVHFDKTKPLAAAGVTIIDDLGRHDLAMGAEQLLEFGAVHAIAEVSNVQLLTH
jgi:hypothetical protein